MRLKNGNDKTTNSLNRIQLVLEHRNQVSDLIEKKLFEHTLSEI